MIARRMLQCSYTSGNSDWVVQKLESFNISGRVPCGCRTFCLPLHSTLLANIVLGNGEVQSTSDFRVYDEQRYEANVKCFSLLRELDVNSNLDMPWLLLYYW